MKELKKITKEELNKILETHKEFFDPELVYYDEDEYEYLLADLSNTDLHGVDLHGADLRKATMYGADLRGANLSGANLSGANLNDADLSGANLENAIVGASLRDANLSGANLYDADLSGASLRGANLSGADLRAANLYVSNLNDTNLKNIKYDNSTLFLGIQCPEEGSFIGYKKVPHRDGDKIVKLLITEDSQRTSGTSRMCRCSKAKVLSITELDGTESETKSIENGYYDSFTYTVGQTKEVMFDPNRFDPDYRKKGIYFFITRDEAVRS